ncbi:MAG: alpha/beta hydrolase [Proteobacteria bacterium]|nr:MAG: alpha/beta hydrolase [Pseudomonadota bacterium]
MRFNLGVFSLFTHRASQCSSLKASTKFWRLALFAACIFASRGASAAPNFDFFPLAIGIKSAPVLIFVHGGAWIGGDKSGHGELGRNFAKAGICTLVMNYRLAPSHPSPAPVRDLEEFLSALPASLPSKACDPKRVYLAGHSAGAQIIAAWNSSFSNPNVKGFVGIEGIYDLPKLAERWPTYPDWFLKKAFGDAKNWPAASPARLTPHGKAPWLLIHSAKDELVDAGQSEIFAEHLAKQKVPVNLLVLPTGSHEEVIQRFGQPTEESTRRALKLLR